MKYLKRHRRNTNIAKVTGGATIIGGGTTAIVGIALIPGTFGASLFLVIGGVAIASAGGITAAGAGIADVVIQRSQDEVQATILIEDFEKLKPIRELVKKMRKKNEKREEKRKGNPIHKFVSSVTRRIADSKLCVVCTIANVVSDVLLISVDVKKIRASLNNIFADKDESRAVVNLCELISELEDEKTEIMKTAHPAQAQL